ncbi:MAG TPA: Rieske 2Fe-2S domain-containing protein [Candidatus Deferrimicrobiaceae bacterium]|nr:Rieske 2Fe-2S domain-containing protein [Candidatus Deferrimicrobiaceae bacterium]
MIGRLLNRVMDAQSPWTKPLGGAVHGLVHPLFQRLSWLRDLLTGRWLGHPLHAALTDVPIGILPLVTVFDVLGLAEAARIATALGVLAMAGSAIAGFADFADTDGRARDRATLHATLMVIALAGYLASLAIRINDPAGPLAVWIAVASLVVLLAGAYVGGDVVYVFGNMVSRHAFRGPGTKWITLEPAELGPDGAIPVGRPVRAKLGVNGLVLVNDGTRILALHDTCAHGGGPLSDGRLVDDQLECPWHYSRFELTTGHVRRGPSVFDQPAYEVRRRDDGGWEARRRPTGGG